MPLTSKISRIGQIYENFCSIAFFVLFITEKKNDQWQAVIGVYAYHLVKYSTFVHLSVIYGNVYWFFNPDYFSYILPVFYRSFDKTVTLSGQESTDYSVWNGFLE